MSELSDIICGVALLILGLFIIALLWADAHVIMAIKIVGTIILLPLCVTTCLEIYYLIRDRHGRTN